MIERVHEHLLAELNKNTTTDTVFIITAILLNLITLGINSGFAAAGNSGNNTFTILMFVVIALQIVVNLVVEIGLITGRQTRRKLLAGLMKMYKDQGVDSYYDSSLLSDYGTRYNLFMLVVLTTGLVALVIPLILRGTLR